MRSSTAAVAIVLMCAAHASAQWAKSADRSIPRTSDGKPNLSAPAPKAPDGKPDLSGIWMPDADSSPPGPIVESSIGLRVSKYFGNIAADLKPDEVILQPSADALFKKRLQSQGKDDPAAHCLPTGVPGIATVPLPHKIVQTPRLVLMLYEEDTVFRQVFLDGRLPVKDPLPRWMGYSSGKWDGNTLVVDTVGFDDRSWLDRMGHPHSDALHVIERIRRTDAGHLETQITIDDPKTYTKPITYTQKATLVPDEDLLEYFCSENEKDVQHFQ
jgi:hypothetical protein